MISTRLTLFRLGDLLFWCLLLGGIFMLSSFISYSATGQAVAVVEINGRVAYRIDLRTNREYTLKEFSNPVKFQVWQNRLKITQNDCPHKICLKMGPISRAGQMIVCVPKKILIYIPVQNEPNKVVRAVTG